MDMLDMRPCWKFWKSGFPSRALFVKHPSGARVICTDFGVAIVPLGILDAGNLREKATKEWVKS